MSELLQFEVFSFKFHLRAQDLTQNHPPFINCHLMAQHPRKTQPDRYESGDHAYIIHSILQRKLKGACFNSINCHNQKILVFKNWYHSL